MAKKKEPKPEPEPEGPKPPEWTDILRLRRQLEAQLLEGRSDDRDMTALYDKTYPVVVPEPEIEDFEPVRYHSGIAGQTVDRYVGFLDAKPVISIEAGMGPDAQTRAERGEQFVNCFFWASERRRGKWWEPVRQDAVKLGRSYVLVLPMPKWWTEAGEYPGETADSDEMDEWKKHELPPILIRQMPADCVLDVTSSGLRVLRALVVMQEPLAEVVSKWGDSVPELVERLADENASPAESVEVLFYLDEKWMLVGVKHAAKEGLVEKPFAHGMGVCPLALFAGKTTGSRKPGKQWKSVLFDAAENLRLADEMTSRKATVVRMFPIPQPWMRVKEGSPERSGRPAPVEYNPKKFLMLWEGEETGFVYPGGVMPEAETLTKQLAEDRQTTLLPDIAAGLDISTTSPAWTVRQRSELMTRGTLLPIAENLVRGAEQLAELIFRAIMSPWIGETVYVRPEGGPGTRPLGIGPEEAKGFVDRISASMNVQGPIDKNQDFALARMGHQELGLPWDFCIQDLAHLENPNALWRRRQIEDVMQSEPYKTRLIEDALAEADLIERKQNIASPEVIAAMWDELPPAAQQALTEMGAPVPASAPAGIPGGEGRGAVYPEGASPIAAAPPMPGEIRGPSPMAPEPGGPEIV